MATGLRFWGAALRREIGETGYEAGQVARLGSCRATAAKRPLAVRLLCWLRGDDRQIRRCRARALSALNSGRLSFDAREETEAHCFAPQCFACGPAASASSDPRCDQALVPGRVRLMGSTIGSVQAECPSERSERLFRLCGRHRPNIRRVPGEVMVLWYSPALWRPSARDKLRADVTPLQRRATALPPGSRVQQAVQRHPSR